MSNLKLVQDAIASLEARRDEIDAELDNIPTVAESEKRGLNEADTAKLDQLLAERKDNEAKIAEHQARAAELVDIAERAAKADAGQKRTGPTFIRPTEAANVADVRNMNPTQVIDQVKRGAELRDIDPTGATKILKRHSRDMRPEARGWLQNIAVRSTDAYTSAFTKVLSGNVFDLSNEERAAIAVGTNSQGGYLVPTHLDPTIILTNTGTANVVRQLSRNVTQVVGNVWHGISSAGVSASFDAELTEVSDDSPSFGAPSVTLHPAQAFVQATLYALEDIDGLASEVLMMLADARDRLEAAKHCTGSGTAEPWGIFTAITSSQAILSDTAATLDLIQILRVKTALGARFRGKSSWVYNPVFGDLIRQLGTAYSANYTVDATAANPDKLVGRPVYETDDAPGTITTTVKDSELVLGDFSNFVIADKPGSMAVQYVPVMFNTTTNLPDGRVGWYAHWRTGSDSVNDAAFRQLYDKTSA